MAMGGSGHVRLPGRGLRRSACGGNKSMARAGAASLAGLAQMILWRPEGRVTIPLARMTVSER
jgi:hypothetical protein